MCLYMLPLHHLTAGTRPLKQLQWQSCENHELINSVFSKTGQTHRAIKEFVPCVISCGGKVPPVLSLPLETS